MVSRLKKNLAVLTTLTKMNLKTKISLTCFTGAELAAWWNRGFSIVLLCFSITCSAPVLQLHHCHSLLLGIGKGHRLLFKSILLMLCIYNVQTIMFWPSQVVRPRPCLSLETETTHQAVERPNYWRPRLRSLQIGLETQTKPRASLPSCCQTSSVKTLK